mmetsp:Transcript_3127/g.9041  ORF Transcript_3127/g.9041 Transcript_3127/m.9041 type:complete len:433 (-) Transcript_3127:517-1815(-)
MFSIPRPRGRKPKGKEWDGSLGRWVAVQEEATDGGVVAGAGGGAGSGAAGTTAGGGGGHSVSFELQEEEEGSLEEEEEDALSKAVDGRAASGEDNDTAFWAPTGGAASSFHSQTSSVSVPADEVFVKLVGGSLKGHTFAAHLLRDDEVYLVAGQGRSTYQLLNARTRHPIGEGKLRFLKEWFREVPPPLEEASPLTERSASRPMDPYGVGGLRPPSHEVWLARQDVDLYTGMTREQYDDLGFTVQVDYVIDPHVVDLALNECFPWDGPESPLDPKCKRVRDEVLHPFLGATGEEFQQTMSNLNNTVDVLSHYWKGRTLKQWCSRFREARGDQTLLEELYPGQSTLASLLRRVMKEPKRPGEWKGQYQEIQVRYNPTWARNVERRMGEVGRLLVGRLRDHEGGEPFDAVARELERIFVCMGLPQFVHPRNGSG